MSFGQIFYRFLIGLFGDVGLGLGFLGVGALVFGPENVDSLSYGIFFIVLGVLLCVIKLVMMLLEKIVFEE